jgi:hypothetical protein
MLVPRFAVQPAQARPGEINLLDIFDGQSRPAMTSATYIQLHHERRPVGPWLGCYFSASSTRR